MAKRIHKACLLLAACATGLMGCSEATEVDEQAVSGSAGQPGPNFGGSGGGEPDPVTMMMNGEPIDMNDLGMAGAAGSGGAGGSGMTMGEVVGAAGDPTTTCEGFWLDEGTWTLQPGENINYCVRIAMPPEFQGRDLALMGWNWDLGSTHHYFMEYSPNPYTKTEPEPCDPSGQQKSFSLLGSTNSENSKIVFGAGEGQGWVMLDPMRGKYLPASGHFRTSHHVLNTSTQPMQVGAKFKVCIKDAQDVPYLVNSLVCTTTAINVPGQGGSGKARATCTATEDIDMVILASHGHQHLTRFTVQVYDGVRTLDPIVYESTDWDSPDIVALDEPIHLEKGQGLTYTCHYEGTGPVMFSDDGSAPNAEHCALYAGYSYPEDRPNEIPPMLFSVAVFPDQVAAVGPSLPGSPI